MYRCNGLSRDAWGITGCNSDRVSQTVNGVTTNYVLDLNSDLTQVLSDGTNDYLYGVGRIAQVNATGTEYFLGDALGSVRQMTDASGAVTLAKSYQPYGEMASSVGSSATSYGFTGEMTDSTDLVYLRARYYSSGMGRFLTRDTWQGNYNRPLSLNRWNYVYANPINYTDPSGHDAGCPNADCSSYDTDNDGYPDKPDPSWPPVEATWKPDILFPENKCFIEDVVECFYRRALLRTGKYQMSGGQMDIFMLAVFYDVHQRPLSGWPERGRLDTPFWDYGRADYKSYVCIDGKCYWGTEINYILQGMFSAKFEGPLLGTGLVCAWKLTYFVPTRQGFPSEGTFYWFGKGFDFYAKRTGGRTMMELALIAAGYGG